MKHQVLILFGGCSTEYEVSLKSAAAVITQLDRSRFAPLLVGITRDGEWLYYAGPVERIPEDSWQQDASVCPAFLTPSRGDNTLWIIQDEIRRVPVDVVFPVLHGRNGEDGRLQGLLELKGIPFVGCGTLASALCMDKEIAHALAQSASVRVPKSVTFRPTSELRQDLERAAELGFPLFVKPANSGSSIGITKAHDFSQLEEGVKQAFLHDSKVVAEQNIPGCEVGCALLGGDSPLLGEIDLIELKSDFFDYQEKYVDTHAQVKLPAPLPAETLEEVRQTAKKLYSLFGCRGLARVDLFVTPQGEVVFNEVNTLPGFTSHSRYPNMIGMCGIGFAQLVTCLIENALEVLS